MFGNEKPTSRREFLKFTFSGAMAFFFGFDMKKARAQKSETKLEEEDEKDIDNLIDLYNQSMRIGTKYLDEKLSPLSEEGKEILNQIYLNSKTFAEIVKRMRTEGKDELIKTFLQVSEVSRKIDAFLETVKIDETMPTEEQDKLRYKYLQEMEALIEEIYSDHSSEIGEPGKIWYKGLMCGYNKHLCAPGF